MIRPSPHDPSQHDDLEFANKLEELSNCVLEGEEIPWEQIRRDHPAWVDRLQTLLPTVLALANDRKSSSSDSLPRAQDDTQRIDQVQLHRMIGRGGMGVVWEGVEQPLDRRVAIKLLDPELAGDARARLRFENEARAAARLQHPNIVPILTIGERDGNMYYSMPYIDGVTLAQLRVQLHTRVSAQTPKPSALAPEHVRTVLRIGIDAAKALHAAHETGVIHRDIKPSNILMESNGHVWILDFGLACLEGQKTITESGEIVGTLRYMAPERFSASTDVRFDPRIDVYSLGATLYELLSMEPPYANHPQAALLKIITNSAPIPLGIRSPSIPTDVVRVVEKAMEREPRYRYASCQEFAEDLQRSLEGQRVQAKRITAWTRAQRYVQSNPFRFAATTLAMSLLVIFGVIAWTWRSELQTAQRKSKLQEDLLEAREDELRARKLFLAVNEAREQRLDKVSGWRAKSLVKLETAALNAKDEAERRLLRDEVAATLMGKDLIKVQTLFSGEDIYSGKWSPDGGSLAIGLNVADRGRDALLVLSGEDWTQTRRFRFPSPRELNLGNEEFSGVRSMAFNSDGSRLVVGMRTGMVHLVDVTTGAVLASARHGMRPNTTIAFSPDDQWIACGGEEHVLFLLHANTLQLQDRHDVTEPMRDIHWSKAELIGMSHRLFSFEVQDGRLQLKDSTPLPSLIPEVGKSLHDGDCFITFPWNSRSLTIIDRGSGESIRSFKTSNRAALDSFSSASRMCLNAQADTFLSTDREGLRLWDYGSAGHVLRIPVSGNSAIGADFHPTGDSIALWGNKELSLWRVSDSTAFGTTQGKMRRVERIGFCNDREGSPWLWTYAVAIRRQGTQWIDLSFFHAANPLETRSITNSIIDGLWPVSSSNRLVTFSGHNGFSTWTDVDPNSKREINEGHADVRMQRLSQDGESVILAIDQPIKGRAFGVRSFPVLKRVDCETGQLKWECSEIANNQITVPMHIHDLAFDTTHVWTLHADSTIRSIRLDDGRVDERIELDLQFVEKLDLSPDGSKVVVGTKAGHVAIVDIKKKKTLAESVLHQGAITGVKFLKDSMMAVSDSEGCVFLLQWDGEQLTIKLRVQYEDAFIEDMQYSPEANLIFLRCRNEHLGRWIRIDKLREEFRRLGIDWQGDAFPIGDDSSESSRLQIEDVNWIPAGDSEAGAEGNRYGTLTRGRHTSGLTVERTITALQRKAYYFSRSVDRFTNSTTTSITTSIPFLVELGGKRGTHVFATSSGDANIDANDWWIGFDDDDPSGGAPVQIQIVRSPRFGLRPEVDLVGNHLVWNFEWTVPAGQTRSLASFTIVSPTRTNALDAINALIDETRFQGQATAFLSQAELDSIANFEFPKPPTDIVLSTDSVRENLPANSVIASLQTLDPSIGDQFTYSLVDGPGAQGTDVDGNPQFALKEDQLIALKPFDFETRNSYSVRVRSTDASGLWIEKGLRIKVLDVMETDATVPLDRRRSAIEVAGRDDFEVRDIRLSQDLSVGERNDGLLRLAVSSEEDLEDVGRSVVVLRDGKYLVGGYSNLTPYQFLVARYMPNNTLDSTFGEHGIRTVGIPSFDALSNRVLVDSKDRILLAGNATSQGQAFFTAVRLLSNGTLDKSFGNDGIAMQKVGSEHVLMSDAILQADGGLVLGGYADFDGKRNFVLMRFDPQGNFDASFGEPHAQGIVATRVRSERDELYQLAQQPDGKILAVGGSQGPDHVYDTAVVRYMPNGCLDTSFGPDQNGRVVIPFGNGTDFAYGVDVASDGTIVISGVATEHLDDDFLVARLLREGALDPSFGPHSKGYVIDRLSDRSDSAYRVLVQPSGRIVVAGVSHSEGDGNRPTMMRYNPDGTRDASFGMNGVDVLACEGEIYGLGQLPDGSIIATGAVRSGREDAVIFRWKAEP